MESLHNEDSVREVKVEIENVEEEMERKLGKSSSEIPPIDVKDFEEHWFGGIRYKNAGINFDSVLSNFLPADEEKVQVITPYAHDEKELVDPPVVLPSTDPSLMDLEKCMEIPPPKRSHQMGRDHC